MAQFCTTFVFVILISHVTSSCYFPFFESSGTCNTDSDCDGSPCVMDIVSSQKVCCKYKKGTISPECPTGTSYQGFPILCNSEDPDSCPTGYTCLKSTSQFTKDDASPSSICCK